MKPSLKGVVRYILISLVLYLLFYLADWLEPHGARGLSAFLFGWIFLKLTEPVPPATSKEGAANKESSGE